MNMIVFSSSPTAFRTASHITLFHRHLGGETMRTSPFTWTTCGSPFDEWFVKLEVQQQVSSALSSQNAKCLLSCSSNLVLAIWNKGAIVVVTKQWHFFFLSLSKFPISSLHRWAICLSWGPGASAHSGAYFTDNTVISGKPSQWQMNLPTVREARALFSD